MFIDGLYNRVAIYPVVHNMVNRKVKDQVANSQEPRWVDVPCRIIKAEKALFEPSIVLEPGDVIEDRADGMRYEVVKEKAVYGLQAQHHNSYEIKVRTYGKKQDHHSD